MNTSVLSLWMVAQAFSAVKASVASTACFYLKGLVLWSPGLTYLQLQQPGCRRHTPAVQASIWTPRTGPLWGGSHCATVRGESSENTEGSFYRRDFIDSAAGFMTCDGWGFFSFPSVHHNRPVIKHPHILSSQEIILLLIQQTRPDLNPSLEESDSFPQKFTPDFEGEPLVSRLPQWFH